MNKAMVDNMDNMAMKRQKRIALINDMTGFGRCSIAVELPLISAMKIQACPLPTAVLSVHTGFAEHYIDDYTDRMRPYMENWAVNGLEDIEAVLNNGQFAVMPLDMCGAIAMKRHFPTAIIYVSKDKEQLIREIIEDDYDTSEKTLRILSIDAEKRNKQICDYVVDNSANEGASILKKLIYG